MTHSHDLDVESTRGAAGGYLEIMDTNNIPSVARWFSSPLED